MKIIYALVVIVLFSGLVSCEKAEGPGGTSSIIGKVWVKDYLNDFVTLKGQYWAEEEDVYLIYGNDSIYSDRTKTNFDGSYWFQYLHEGTYTVFVYSKDSSRVNYSPSGRIVVKQTVTIDKSKSDVIVPLITIFN